MKHASSWLWPFVWAAMLGSRSSAGDGEEFGRRAAFPSPRYSHAGRVAFSASNVQLLGWKALADFPGGNTSASDCWGYTSPSGREYAILGLSHGTAFVDVTDPGDPVVVHFEPLNPAPSVWRCLKTIGAYAYGGSESGGGIQVFDMTHIDSGVVVSSSVTGSTCTTATHTLAAEGSLLYRAGGGGLCAGVYQGLQIYRQDEKNPTSPVLVGQWNTGRYVHECQVQRDRGIFGRTTAFCFTEDTSGGGDPRLEILDVTNPASITLLSSISYPGAVFSHQGWAAGTTLYLNDELDEGTFGPSCTRIFDIGDLEAPVYLGFFTSGAPSIDHNLYVKGNRIYESNYRSGLHVFDSSQPTAPFQVGFFDTYPEDDRAEYNSLWSNYPFFHSGTIIGGDIEKGLFVWREGAAKLTFDFPQGVPSLLSPAGGTIQFAVSESAPGSLVAGSVQFHYGTGGSFTTLTPSSVGGDLYQVTLPELSCLADVDFYVSAQSIGNASNVTWTDPPAAPTQVHLGKVANSQTTILEDTLEADTGWLVGDPGDTATTGVWTRQDPIGTSAQPDGDHTQDPGTLCWFTGQGSVNGAPGEADVDGGVTTLRSPILDTSGRSEPVVSYWRWFSNNEGQSPAQDTFLVDISNDGGASWVPLEVVGPSSADSRGGWMRHSARIADFVAPTNGMRLRFRAQDLDPGSIVEAAIDDLRIDDYFCEPLTITSITPATGGYGGGTLVSITGTGFHDGVTTVTFGNLPATAVQVLSPTLLTARTPPRTPPYLVRRRIPSLPVDVTVSHPGSFTVPKAFTYLKALP